VNKRATHSSCFSSSEADIVATDEAALRLVTRPSSHTSHHPTGKKHARGFQLLQRRNPFSQTGSMKPQNKSSAKALRGLEMIADVFSLQR
jgi:hypothetical protein